jgi:phage baseplate assembly protein W
MARPVYQYQPRIEKPDVALGILLPMNKSANNYVDPQNSATFGDVDDYSSGSLGGNGVFAQSYTTEQQSISNLKNLLLTAKGERYMQPNFGTRIRQVIFDNNTIDVQQRLRDTLIEDIEFWLPYIGVNDVEILADEDRYTINIRLSFEITTIGANIVINILLNENSLIISDPLSSIGPNASELVQVGQIGSATAFGGSAGIGVVGGGGY